MSNVMDNRCPSCNAPITFKPHLGKFKCDYCDSEFVAEQLKTVEDATVPEDKLNVEYVSYNCPDCGAQIIADETTSATFCVYCGNSSILKNKLSGEFKPHKIIPFKKEKSDAVNAFKSLIKGRPFAPREFVSEKNIEKITGLYVPFWLYDFTVNGFITVNGTKVSSWRTGDVVYTKTDYYDVLREGTFCYDLVPADGSKKIDDVLMQSIEPFNYKEMIDYNPAYLSGFLADRFDVSKEDACKDSKSRVLNSTEEQMVADCTGYSSKIVNGKNLTVTITDTKYALLPVWMVNVKYQDKYYLFVMNGQTGEFIGDIPLDKRRAVLGFFAMSAISFVGVLLIYFVLSFMGVY